jgi:serine/threonine-protein kinase
VGKAGYMSPEQARGESVDARSDVFASGILLWELLAGRRMYKATESEDLLALARRAEVPELPKKGFEQEDRLHEIVHRALAQVREDRYETASAMLRDLEGWMAAAKLLASSLKFGAWLGEHLPTAPLDARREAEARLGDGAPAIPEARVSGPGISQIDEPDGALLSSPLFFPRPSLGAMRAFKAGLAKDGVGHVSGPVKPTDPQILSAEDEAAFSRRPKGNGEASTRIALLALGLIIVLLAIYMLRS